jgi:hypothetical protein
MSDYKNIIEDLNSQIANEELAAEISPELPQLRGSIPIKREPTISNISEKKEKEIKEPDGALDATFKWLSNTVATIGSSTLDFVGGAFDVGDWHHTLDVVNKIPYTGGNLNPAVAFINGVSEFSRFIDNTIGDGEDYVGNWIMDSDINKSLQQFVQDNQINTSSDGLNYVLNTTSSLIGSVVSFGGASTAVGRGIFKGLGKLGRARKLGTKAKKRISQFTGAGLMTQAISAKLGKETYDNVYNSYLDQEGYSDEKQKTYEEAYSNFIQNNKNKVSAEQLTDQAKEYAERVTNLWNEEWLANNNELVDQAKKNAIAGANLTMNIASASFALNLTGSALALRGMQDMVTRGATTQATKYGFLQQGGLKDFAIEAAQEVIEEAGIERYASKFGEAYGKKEKYDFSDAWNDFMSMETLESAFWATVGSGAQMGVTNRLTYKSRKEAADKAQDAINQANKILPQLNGNTPLDQITGLHNTYNKVAEIADEAEKLRQQGKHKEADELNNAIVYNLALQNFRTGTTDKLIEIYENISTNENYNEETRKRSAEIVKEISQLEKIYDDVYDKGYANAESVYQNRANSFFLQKGINELETQISEQRTNAAKDLLNNEANLPSKKVSNVEENKLVRKGVKEKKEELNNKLKQDSENSQNTIASLKEDIAKNEQEIISLNNEGKELRTEEKSLKEKLAELVKKLIEADGDEKTKLESEQQKLKSDIQLNEDSQNRNALDINKLENSITNADKIITREEKKLQDYQNEFDKQIEEYDNIVFPDDETELDVSLEDVIEGREFEYNTEKQTFQAYQNEANKLDSVRQLKKSLESQDLLKRKRSDINKDYNKFVSREFQLELYYQNKFTSDVKKLSEQNKKSVINDDNEYEKQIRKLGDKYKGRINDKDLEEMIRLKLQNFKDNKIAARNKNKAENKKKAETISKKSDDQEKADEIYNQIFGEEEGSEVVVESNNDNNAASNISEEVSPSGETSNAINSLFGQEVDEEVDEQLFEDGEINFSPLSSDDITISDNQIKRFKQLIDRITIDEGGIEPNFEKYIQYIYNTIGKENLKANWNLSVNGWKANKGDADFNAVYDKYFGETTEQLINSIFGSNQNTNTAQNKDVDTQIKEELTDQIEIKVVEKNEIVISDDVNDLDISFVQFSKDEEGNYNYSELTPGSDTPGSLYVLDNESYLEGEELTIGLYPADKLNNFKVLDQGIKNENALSSTDTYESKEGEYIPFLEYVNKYGLSQEDSQYWEKVPLAVYDNQGNVIAIIQDPSYLKNINNRKNLSVAERNKQIEKLNNIRSRMREADKSNSKLTAVITQKTNGTLDAARDAAGNDSFKLSELKNYYVAVKGKNGAMQYYDSDGNVINVKSEQLLLKDNTIPYAKNFTYVAVPTNTSIKVDGETLPQFQLFPVSNTSFTNNQSQTLKNLLLFHTFHSDNDNYRQMYNAYVDEYNTREGVVKLPRMEELDNIKKLAAEKGIDLSNNQVVEDLISKLTITSSNIQVGNNQFFERLKNQRSGSMLISINQHKNSNPKLTSSITIGVNQPDNPFYFSTGRMSEKLKDLQVDNFTNALDNVVDNLNKISATFENLQNAASFKGIKNRNTPMIEITGSENLKLDETNSNYISFLNDNLEINMKPFTYQDRNGNTKTTFATTPNIKISLTEKTINETSETTEEVVDFDDTETVVENVNEIKKDVIEKVTENVDEQIQAVEEKYKQKAERAALTKEERAEKIRQQEDVDENNRFNYVYAEVKKDDIVGIDQHANRELIQEEGSVTIITNIVKPTKKQGVPEARGKVDIQTFRTREEADAFIKQDKQRQLEAKKRKLAKYEKQKQDEINALKDTTEETKVESEEAVLKKVEEDLSIIEDIDGEFMIFSPLEISEASAQAVVENLNKYSGIQPHHFDNLVDFAFYETTLFINKNLDKGISSTDVADEINRILTDTINSRLEDNSEMIDKINNLTNISEEEKQKYIEKYDALMQYTNNILDNKKSIIDAAFSKVNIKDLKTPEDFDKDQSEENEIKEVYDKSFLEKGGKTSISKEVREFLTGIRETDKEGNLLRGFLGLPSNIPVDTSVEVLQQLLSDQNVSFDKKIKILEDNYKAYPFLKQVVDKLKSDQISDKVKNQFLSFFDKNKLNMKFVMFTIGRDGRPSVKLMDTNSSDIARSITKSWNVNLKQSPLLTKNVNGEYVYNKDAVDKAADKLRKVLVKPDDTKNIPSVRKSKQRKLDKGENPRQVLSEDDKGFSFVYKNQSYLYQGNGNFKKIDNLSTIEKIEKGVDLEDSINELLDALEGVGITLSNTNIENILRNGIYISSENNRIDFKRAFGNAPTSIVTIIGKELIKIQDEMLLEGNNFLNQTILKNFALEESKFTDSIIPTAFRDDQKLLQSYIYKTYIKEREEDLKSDDDTMRKNLLKQPFSKHSMLLDLLDQYPKIRNSFNVNYLGLTSLKQRGQRSYQGTRLQDLSDADQEMVKLGAYTDMKLGSFDIQYKGIGTRTAAFFGLTMSDKSTMTVNLMPALDFRDDTLNENNQENNNFTRLNDDIVPGDDMLDVLYSQTILPELERIINYLSTNFGSDIKGYNQGAKTFLFFPGANEIFVDFNGSPQTLLDVAEDMNQQDAIKKYLNGEETDSRIIEFMDGFKKESIKMLRDTVSELSKNKLANWTQYGIVEAQGSDTLTYRNKLIDNDYLKKFSENTNLLDSDRIVYASIEYVVNNMISNANQFMTMAGDPAMYYKAKSTDSYTEASRKSAENINKRLAAMIAPGVKLANSNEQYIQILAKDAEVPANNLSTLVKLLDNKTFNEEAYLEARKDKEKLEEFLNQYPNTKPYFNIESTDAQEYTTWKEHLHVLEELGKVKPGLIDTGLLKEAEKLIQSGKALEDMSADEKEIIKFVFQPIKPVYTGQTMDALGNQTLFRSVYIKSSSIPLLPQITQGTQLDVVRQAMEKIQAKGKNVRFSFNTANKVGSVNDAVNLFDDNGNIMQQDVDTLVQSFENSSILLDRNNFRIQQEVPYKGEKETVSQGTQTTKLLFGNGVTEMDGFVYRDKPINGSDLEREFFKNFEKLLDVEKESLYDELGIDINTNKPIDFKSTANKLKDLLTKEATERNYDQQVIDSFEIDYEYTDGEISGYKFKMPLWLSPSSNRIESLLNSIVTNRIAKVKLPGNTFVVASPEGYKKLTPEQLKQQKKTFDESKIIYINKDFDGEVKGVEINKDGSIIHKTQVLMPSRLKDNDGNLIDLFDGYVELQPDGRYILKKDKIDEKLLSNISFRTPTSAHQSMLDVEIVGFLPPEAGDLMIVPRNTLTQVGLDFDIDKQTNYSLYHYVDQNGNVKVISNNSKKVIEQLKKAKNPARIKELKERLKKIYKNNIIEIHSSVLSNPQMQSSISKALSMDWASGQADFINGLVTSANNAERDANSMASFTMLSDSYQKELVTLGASGKVGIGAYSIDVVFHSLLNQQRESIEVNTFLEGARFGNIVGSTTLGKKETVASDPKYKRDISDVLTERQNLATDNAKEQALEKLFLNKETFDADKAMTLMGFDKDENGNSLVGLFLNQPIIRDYVNYLNNINSVIAEFVPDRQLAALEYVLEKYVSNPEKIEEYNQAYNPDFQDPKAAKVAVIRLQEQFRNINGTVLQSQIENNGDNELIQFLALQQFILFDKAGKELRKVQSFLNVDSQGLGKSFFDVIDKKQKFESYFFRDPTLEKPVLKKEPSKFLNLFGRVISKPLSEVDNKKETLIKEVDGNAVVFIPTTVAGKMISESLYSAYNLWSEHFPYDKGNMSRAFDQILKARGIDPDNSFAVTEAKQKAKKELIKLINSTLIPAYNTDSIFNERQRLFTEKQGDSLAKYLYSLQSSDNKVVNALILKNPLIKSFEYDIDNDNGLSLVKFNNAVAQEIDKKRLYNSIANLIQKNLPLPEFNGKPYTTRMLAQDLVTYSMLEGGVQEAIQFSKYIPVSYLLEIGYNNIIDNNSLGLNDKTRKIADYGKSEFPSKWQIQYAQHNVEEMPSVDVESITLNDDQTEFSFNNITEEQANLIQLGGMYDYLDPIYKVKINRKRVPFYRVGINLYKRADVLNSFGTNEYDINTENDSVLSIDKTLDERNNEQEKLDIETETSKPDITGNNAIQENSDSYSVRDGNLKNTLLKIANGNETYLSKLAEIFVDILPENISLEVKDLSKYGAAAGFAFDKVIIDKNFLNNSTDSSVAEKILHEVIHAFTVNTLDEYVYLDKDGNAVLESVENIPGPVQDLVRLFNYSRNQFEKNNSGLIKSVSQKRENNQPLSTENKEFVAYAFTSLKEFLANLTNEDFVKELDSQKFKNTDKTLLEKFKEILVDLVNNVRSQLNFEQGDVDVLKSAFDSLFKIAEIQTGVKISSIQSQLNAADKILKDQGIEDKRKSITIGGLKYKILDPTSNNPKLYNDSNEQVFDKDQIAKGLVNYYYLYDQNEYKKRMLSNSKLQENKITIYGDNDMFIINDNQAVSISPNKVMKVVKPAQSLLNLYKGLEKPTQSNIKRTFAELENPITDQAPEVQSLFNNPTIELYNNAINNYEFELSADLLPKTREKIESLLRDVKKSFSIQSIDKPSTTQPQIDFSPTPVGYKPVSLQNISDEKATITNADALNKVLISKDGNSIFTAMGRNFVLANVNGVVIPYYISSAGTDGKIKGAWYPFFGYTGNWLVKGSINKKTGEMSYSPSIDRVTKLLNDNLKFINPSEIGIKGELVKKNRIKNDDGTISIKTINVGNTSDYGLKSYSVFERFPKEKFPTLDPGKMREGMVFDREINKPVHSNSMFVKELTGLYPIDISTNNSNKWIKDIIEKVEKQKPTIEFSPLEVNRITESTEVFKYDKNPLEEAKKQGKVFRGVSQESQFKINEDSSLTLFAKDNFGGKTTGVSLSPYLDTAMDYATRRKDGTSKRGSDKGTIITITNPEIINSLKSESYDELFSNKQLTIKEGDYSIQEYSYEGTSEKNKILNDFVSPYVKQYENYSLGRLVEKLFDNDSEQEIIEDQGTWGGMPIAKDDIGSNIIVNEFGGQPIVRVEELVLKGLIAKKIKEDFNNDIEKAKNSLKEEMIYVSNIYGQGEISLKSIFPKLTKEDFNKVLNRLNEYTKQIKSTTQFEFSPLQVSKEIEESVISGANKQQIEDIINNFENTCK